jgi:hypothetical protein
MLFNATNDAFLFSERTASFHQKYRMFFLQVLIRCENHLFLAQKPVALFPLRINFRQELYCASGAQTVKNHLFF